MSTAGRFALLSLVVAVVACSSSNPKSGPAASTTPTPAAATTAKPTPDVNVGLGFVLLAKAELPTADAVMREYARLAPDGPTLGTPDSNDTVHTFQHGDGVATVAVMTMPVPKGEADYHAQFSVPAILGKWTLAPHGAHLIVATMFRGESALERTRTTHRFIAAVAAAAGANAVGVYIGRAGVTHEPAFYIDAVAETPDAMMAWTGVGIAHEGDRVVLLSTGMQQFDLPDIAVTAKTTPAGKALGALFDLLLYVAQRGEPIPDGDTVGQDADERIEVHYVASPADPSRKVMRVDYP